MEEQPRSPSINTQSFLCFELPPHEQQTEELHRKSGHVSTSGRERRIDALTTIELNVPPTVVAVIRNSVDNIRAQINIEAALHNYENKSTRELPKEENYKTVENGKRVEAPPANSISIIGTTPAAETSVESDSESFYTTFEWQTHSRSNHFMVQPEMSSVENVPRNRASNSQPGAASRPEFYPTRRDLVKTALQRIRNTDARGRLGRHSMQPLSNQYFITKFKNIKAFWPREPPEIADCIACLDNYVVKDLVRLSCHSYCKPCFRHLIANAIQAESQWPPRCCITPIDYKKCLKHISGDLERQFKCKRMEYSTPIDRRYYCPIPDCGAFVPLNTNNLAYRRVRCPKRHLTCIDCHQRSHNDIIDCANNRDIELVQKLAYEEGWRRCYRCHIMVEHEDACRHMTCRCGAEFCYVCGSRWQTCTCTEQELDEIKNRARENASRRMEEDRERQETLDLQKDLEAIADMEAKASEKYERIRRAKEARRKEQMQSMYAEFRVKLETVNDFQRGLLENQHQFQWFELVITERYRLLDEFLAVEMADEIMDSTDERWSEFTVQEELMEVVPSV